MRTELVRSGLLVMAGVVLAGGCGGNGGKHGVECEHPGERDRCVCTAEMDGTRTCQEDGYWGECDCDTPYAEGDTGAGGMGDSTGGTTGAQTGGTGGRGTGGSPGTEVGGIGGSGAGGDGGSGGSATGGDLGSGGSGTGGDLGSGGSGTGGDLGSGGSGTGGDLGSGGSATGGDGGSGTGGDGGSGGSGAGGDPGSGGSGTGEPFKGLANSPAGEMAALGATWCYNWMTSPQASDCADPLFVPMVWGPGDVAGAIQQIANAGYTTVLGFNEPNKTDQANMTVAQAIALWPDMTSNPNLRVSSPAVSDDGRAWLEDFMDQVQANGFRVDFIAMHWYGWNAGSCTAGALEGAINWAQQWGLPVWITEFGCMGSSNPDEQTLLDFFPAAVAMIASHPLVERYAWYPWNTYNDLYLADGDGVRVITALGEAFAAAPGYR